ncbi:UNVERIFIED_CONTAM: hypothetical protein K2H54_018869 [Gekko kuhli]
MMAICAGDCGDIRSIDYCHNSAEGRLLVLDTESDKEGAIGVHVKVEKDYMDHEAIELGLLVHLGHCGLNLPGIPLNQRCRRTSVCP